LIVDDSAIILKATKRDLEQAGFAVETVHQSADQSPLLSFPPVDLVLIDVVMPRLYGDAAVRIARSPGNPGPPVCLFSDLTEAELRQRAERIGAVGYVTKKSGPERLVAKVKQIFEQLDHDGSNER
jgi:DNA-binding response OmpR family regulator